jgi:tetratricopeptide (TPR) repeat protein
MKPVKFKIMFLYLLLASLFSNAGNNQALVDSANNAYSKNNFDAAVNYYEKIINSGFESGEIYYNLGNSYFKLSKISLAILNYERAAKLLPNDEDIKFNLKLANQKIIDKIERLPKLMIHEWKDNFLNSLSEKEWSILSIILLTIALGLLAIYLSGKKLLLKQVSFGFALLFFVVALTVFFIAKKQYNNSVNNKEAIIISGSTDVTSSPSENGTKAFVLHEGTKVTVTESSNDWVEIRLPNGNVGWIRSSELAFI